MSLFGIGDDLCPDRRLSGDSEGWIAWFTKMVLGSETTIVLSLKDERNPDLLTMKLHLLPIIWANLKSFETFSFWIQPFTKTRNVAMKRAYRMISMERANRLKKVWGLQSPPETFKWKNSSKMVERCLRQKQAKYIHLGAFWWVQSQNRHGQSLKESLGLDELRGGSC